MCSIGDDDNGSLGTFKTWVCLPCMRCWRNKKNLFLEPRVSKGYTWHEFRQVGKDIVEEEVYDSGY